MQNIIKQSYKNFELILVDDNSRDKLNIEQINFEDIPVQHIVNEVNLGANQSRLIGLRHSKGKYVCFHDDDDYWMTDKLFKQVKFLDNNPEYYIVSAYAKTKAKVIKFPPNPSSFSLSIYNAVGSFSIPMIRNTNLLAKSLDNDLTNAQDWHVWRVFVDTIK